MERPLVGIIIPAYNEAGNLPPVIDQITTTLEDQSSHEIIIVNDNSTDGTGAVADRLADEYSRVEVVHRDTDPGIGNAIQEGMEAVSSEIVVLFMADQSDDPKTIPRMVDAIQDGADVVYGSRFIPGGETAGYPAAKLLANRCYNHLVRFLFQIPHLDVSNAFKAYRREVIDTLGVDSIQSPDFGVTIELPVKAHLHGFTAVEIPTTWRSRESGVSSLRLHTKGPQYANRLLSLYWRQTRRLLQ